MSPSSPVRDIRPRLAVPSPADVASYAFDPFHERTDTEPGIECYLLGGRFRFQSAASALLAIVDEAYAGLPGHRWVDGDVDFHIELRLVPREGRPDAIEPPAVQTHGGQGVICAVMDACNYAVLMPAQRRALVVISQDMLRYRYHLRYELIEFAVFVLAARGMGLVPLHGACVGRDGRGVLLLGASGAGKSTLTLNCLLRGWDVIAEDAVFVRTGGLLATGVANFLHVKTDALDRIEDDVVRRWIGGAPVIRRRSGVEKFEADLRHSPGHAAAAPLVLAGAIFVSDAQAHDPGHLLTPLSAASTSAHLAADQPYAASQPGWTDFVAAMAGIGVHELRRGCDPMASVDALATWLDG
ncbi:serine kinase [Dyella sp.]|uniref:serine kinase n=1 Tax=Dyella sp. TaxID=1869338 RepID=UPI002ED2BF92